MPTNSLSDHKCKAAKPQEKPYKLFDGHGMHLYVSPTGAKVWRMAYRVGKKAQTATFGPYPLLSLAEARAKRDELRKKLLEGDPAKEAKAIERLTLKQACEQYWAGRDDLTDAYKMNAKRAIAMYIEPYLGDRYIDTITKADVMAPLKVMNDKGLHNYVRKTRMWLGQVFDWSVEAGDAKINPCALIRPEKAFGSSPVESFPALKLRDIPEFMERLALEYDIQSAIACKLLALTWVRTTELRGMRWSELHGTEWEVPKDRMKRKRDHLVPLSTQALALIEKMRARRKDSDFVFPNELRLDRPMSENAITYLMHRMGYKDRMTGHGWRTVASTWANERGYNKDAIERQLAHSPDDKVRFIYNRAEYMDERRAMLQAYADWLMPGI